MIQEYIAGADSIAEDPATRDYVVMRARMMAAKSVYWKSEKILKCNLSFLLYSGFAKISLCRRFWHLHFESLIAKQL